MIYLTKNQIVTINKLTISHHGGNFLPPSNFLHEDSLDYLIEAVHAEMFGAPLYPRIEDKAGLIMFSIISNHVFSDGNKRTGLEAGLVFLKANGYRIAESATPTIFDFTIKVASGQLSLEETQEWFSDNIVKQKLS